MTRSLTLTPEDRTAIEALLDKAETVAHDVEDPRFLDELPVLSHELPLPVRRFVTQCRSGEVPLFAIRGWRVDDEALGPTPVHWRTASSSRTLRLEMLLALVGALAGDIFSFASVQEGRLINHVLPVAGEENLVSASSSRTALAWHTEGAGLECRADYQAFMCLRNPDRVPTDVAAIAKVDLEPELATVLRAPRFVTSALGPDGALPVRTPVIFGATSCPYVRIDPVYMRAADGDGEAEHALAEVTRRLDSAVEPFHQEPGDLYFIDNYQLVHGRPAFQPRFDGTDRWLMRTKLARDIRTSRPYRDGPEARIVNLRR
jgi:hypothetical protein